jgi:hypothetical protein
MTFLYVLIFLALIMIIDNISLTQKILTAHSYMIRVSKKDWKPDVCHRNLYDLDAVATPPTIRATVRVKAYRVACSGDGFKA